MRRRRDSLQDEGNASVDMTSLLDIIFIMLIFFIVTTSFVKEQGFVVGKSAASKAAAKSPTIMIHVDKNGIIYMNNRAVDLALLSAQIEVFTANHPTKAIIFRPHEETNYQQVVDILDRIKPFKRLKISIGIYKP